MDDKESLRKAIKGAHGVFAVTNFWDSMNGDKEIAQGKNIADICKVRTLPQYILDLPNLPPGRERPAPRLVQLTQRH